MLQGSIRIIQTPERLDELRQNISRQRWNDAPAALLTPEEIKAICPLIDVEGAGVRRF